MNRLTILIWHLCRDSKMAKSQLKDLAKATEVARDLRRFQREIDLLSERLVILVQRYEEVSMETREARLLLDQIVAGISGRDQPAEDTKDL